MVSLYDSSVSKLITAMAMLRLMAGRFATETVSEHFLEFPSRLRLGRPKPYNSRLLKPPEHFQNSLPLSTAGDASFFRIGSGEGLSELVMEFTVVLRVFLKLRSFRNPLLTWSRNNMVIRSLPPFSLEALGRASQPTFKLSYINGGSMRLGPHGSGGFNLT